MRSFGRCARVKQRGESFALTVEAFASRIRPAARALRSISWAWRIQLLAMALVGVAASSSFAEESWWSLKPLANPEVPSFADDWVRSPVDAFLLARLRREGISPSPEADRRTLIRRLTFDLHGLPPSPAEIDDFLADDSDRAYERLVERLLASPRYGERWGRHWLDLVHFGESHGYDKDKARFHAWPYRDYVIGAFQRDKPYADFVFEQLAGDSLAPESAEGPELAEGIVATGFVAAGPWDFVGHVELREGTVDKEIARSNDRDDMVMTAISTFNSVTAHCARCHDHKFDPIPQADYYALQAVFAGVDRGDRPYFANEAARKARDELLADQAAVKAQLAEAERRRDALSSEDLVVIDKRIEGLTAELASLPKLEVNSPSNGYHSLIEPSADVEKWVVVDLGASYPLDSIRLVPARPTDFPDTPGFGFPARFRVEVSESADFSRSELVFDGTAGDQPNPGDETLVWSDARQARYVRVVATRLWKRLEEYVLALGELQAWSGGRNVALGRAVTSLDTIDAGRWSRAALVDGFDSRYALEESQSTDSPAAKLKKVEARLREWRRFREDTRSNLLDPATRSELAQLPERLKQIDEHLAKSPPDMVYAAVDIAPRPVHRLERGDVRQPQEAMIPGALSCLSGLNSRFDAIPRADGRGRRAALARWIVDPANVLTWRSIVNRVWQFHFGQGIVDTPNDFGQMGSEPSHPELLDWLANEFLRSGGSIKSLHRTILMGSAYRQSSRHDEEAARIDGENRLLWRAPRARLDAEEVRDAVLFASGKLDFAMGGPSVRQFMFKDDHSPIYDYAKFDVEDPSAFRRGVYRFIARSAPDPFMECLDCADPSLLTPKRNATLTALQSLALLNDRLMVSQSRHFAQRLESSSPNSASRIATACLWAWGRAPSESESAELVSFAERFGLANACRAIFNSNEFLFVD